MNTPIARKKQHLPLVRSGSTALYAISLSSEPVNCAAVTRRCASLMIRELGSTVSVNVIVNRKPDAGLSLTGYLFSLYYILRTERLSRAIYSDRYNGDICQYSVFFLPKSELFRLLNVPAFQDERKHVDRKIGYLAIESEISCMHHICLPDTARILFQQSIQGMMNRRF